MKTFIKKYSSKKNLLSFSMFLIAFILPFEKTTIRYALVVFLTLYFFYGDYKELLNKKKWWILSLTILWILPFIQLLLFQKIDVYWSSLMTKLSLLILPIIIVITSGYHKMNIGKTLFFFTIGCIISAAFCGLFSIFNYYFLVNENAFKYASISVFHHPGYFTMYLNFSIALLYYNLLKPETDYHINRKWSVVIISLLTFFILIASSRTGWVTNVLIQFFFISTLLVKKKLNSKFFIYFLLLSIPFSTTIYFNNTIKSRFQEVIMNTTSSENSKKIRSSTSVRKKIWKTSFELIKKKWLFGYGIGIGKKKLENQYEKEGFIYLHQKKYNTHNQYLQFFIDHGIVGLFILIFFTFGMIIISLRQKKYIYTLFLVIIIINFMTESVLETQSGVIFFAFFNTIFFYDCFNNKNLAF